MERYLFVGLKDLDISIFQSGDAFMEQDMDFFEIALNNEKELRTLFQLLRIPEAQEIHLEGSQDFSKVYDFTSSTIPVMNQEKFDQFYKKWIYESGRDNNTDEYGQLAFIKGRAKEWNNLGGLVVAKCLT